VLPLVLAGCRTDTGEAGLSSTLTSQAVPGFCRSTGFRKTLPAAVQETSGLALSRSGRTLLWTHNDSGNDPVIYALDTTGTILGQVAVAGSVLLDWEDIAAGPCDSGNCLFIADIGDNFAARSMVAIYVIPEPSPDAGQSEVAVSLLARFPDGSQDAEAIFVLPNGDLYLVTKGRQAGIALYRFPKAEQQPGNVATLELVRPLWPRPSSERDRVTGATASPDGRWVAIRTYRTLHLYGADALIGQGEATVKFDLTPLRERQGEAVALTNEGDVWLSTESEIRWRKPALLKVRCRLD
jgi:hypothetical protein